MLASILSDNSLINFCEQYFGVSTLLSPMQRASIIAITPRNAICNAQCNTKWVHVEGRVAAIRSAYQHLLLLFLIFVEFLSKQRQKLCRCV
jgi:hypothetical protein